MPSDLGRLKCLGRSNQEDASQSTTTTGSAVTEKGGTAGAGLHGDDSECLPLGTSSCRAMPASCATHRGVRICQVCHRQANGRNTRSHLAQVGNRAEGEARWRRAGRSGWRRLACQVRPALKGFKYGRRLSFARTDPFILSDRGGVGVPSYEMQRGNPRH